MSIEKAADFRVVWENDDLMVVDKPSGLLVHPSKPCGPVTLWDILREFLCYEIANGGQVSLINRLERETSGLVMVAKTSRAARQAAIVMQDRGIRKSYVAIVTGWPIFDEWIEQGPIIRQGLVSETKIHLKRIVHPAGAPSETRFRVTERMNSPSGPVALVAAEPITGRTHQIRVHLAEAGHPVVGDKIYGLTDDYYLEFVRAGWTENLAACLPLGRHALHASSLRMHWDGDDLTWECPLPQDMATWLERTTRCPRSSRSEEHR